MLANTSLSSRKHLSLTETSSCQTLFWVPISNSNGDYIFTWTKRSTSSILFFSECILASLWGLCTFDRNFRASFIAARACIKENKRLTYKCSNLDNTRTVWIIQKHHKFKKLYIVQKLEPSHNLESHLSQSVHKLHRMKLTVPFQPPLYTSVSREEKFHFTIGLTFWIVAQKMQYYLDNLLHDVRITMPVKCLQVISSKDIKLLLPAKKALGMLNELLKCLHIFMEQNWFIKYLDTFAYVRILSVSPDFINTCISQWSFQL